MDQESIRIRFLPNILADLSKLNSQQAIKIPLSSLNGDKMQNLRSALNRVTREKNIPVVTSSDEKYLYVWRANQAKNTGVAADIAGRIGSSH